MSNLKHSSDHLKERVFRRLGGFIHDHYIMVLVGALLLTFLMLGLSSQLKMDMTWLGMTPRSSYPYQEFNRINDKFKGVNPIIITLKSDDRELMEKVLLKLAGEYRGLGLTITNEDGKVTREDYIKSVNYRIDPDFISKYGLLMQKTRDIKRFGNMMSELEIENFLKNLNDDFEKEYIGEEEESLADQEKEAQAGLDMLNDLLTAMEVFLADGDAIAFRKSVREYVRGREYFMSPDHKMVLFYIQPYASVNEVAEIIPVVEASEVLLEKYREKYKEVEFGQTGMAVVSRDEMKAGTEDTVLNIITALIAILILLTVSFRMISAPFLALVALICGIIWDMGLAWLLVGKLNMMTAMTAVFLLGLGIDYSIHIISGFTQARHRGLDLRESTIDAFVKSGPGLLTGALTTAIAFSMFTIGDMETTSELGIIMSSGIFLTFISAMFILPALMIMKDRILGRVTVKKQLNMEMETAAKTGAAAAERPWLTILAVLAVTGFFAYLIPKIYFITDLKKLEMEGLLSLELMDEIVEKYDIATDPLIFTVTDLDELHDKTERLDKFTSVGMVDSIAAYLPSAVKQDKRLKEIGRIDRMISSMGGLKKYDDATMLKEIRRLEMNVIEIGDMAFMGSLNKVYKRTSKMANRKEGEKLGSNIFDRLTEAVSKAPADRITKMRMDFAAVMAREIKTMSTGTRMSMEDIPASIREYSISDDGTEYLVRVHSAKEIWANFLTSPFIKDVKKVQEKFTGMPALFNAVVETSKKSGKLSTILTLLAIFILIIIDFRSLKYGLIATAPLIIGSIWVFGFLVLSGINFSWMTIMVVPLVIGMGIDDGVHIIHRYRMEGTDGIYTTLKTTGKAVVLTSLTTMLAFGSLKFSKMVGMQHFGITLFFGIGSLLLLSLLLLPAILKLTDKSS